MTEHRKQLEEQIEQDYQKAILLFGDKKDDITRQIQRIDGTTSLFMKYLYANMPLSDVSDYEFELFLSYAGHAEWLLKNPLFQEEFPQEYFYEYVLAHRINSEDITDCRSFFYHQVKDRIKGMTMEEAVLELNNWCYEQATYRSTSTRTASPLTVYKGGFGRCGEESTFLTTVLRSVGIPARQIYVPRWSHSDSNHAWVEVWLNGTWRFTGSCEPKPVLNNGWFSYAASRAMLIHSRVFDELPHNKEEVSYKDGIVAELNLTNHYAFGRKVAIAVFGKDGQPAVSAKLRFEIMNSAEFFPIAILTTDESGEASLILGQGDVYITVYYEDKIVNGICNIIDAAKILINLQNYSIKTVTDAGNSTEVTSFSTEPDHWQKFLLTPPVSAKVNEVSLSKKQELDQENKNKAGDLIRKQRQESYIDEEYLAGFHEYPVIVKVLKDARGNFDEIRKFLDAKLQEAVIQGAGLAEKQLLLSTIAYKDCRDIKAETLLDHMSAFEFQKEYEADLFRNYLLCPHVDMEFSTPYRAVLKEFFKNEKEQLKENPERIWDYIKTNIEYVPEREYTTIFTTPCGIIKTKKGTPESQKIIFVATCRTLGIPARLEPYHMEPQYFSNGEFINVEAEYTPAATLKLVTKQEPVPVYERDFSIGRKCSDGSYKTISLDTVKFVEGSCEVKLAAGDYRILTCDRLNSGSILGKQFLFTLKINGHKEIELSTHELCMEDQINSITLPKLVLTTTQGEQVSFSEISAEGKHIIIYAKTGAEPTEHLFNEMLEINSMSGFAKCGIHVIVKDEKDCEDETFVKIRTAFPQIRFYYDQEITNAELIADAADLDVTKFPLVVVTDGRDHGIYACCGYRIGTGDVLFKLI